MASKEYTTSQIINYLLDSMPQYVLGTLLSIAIIGSSPKTGFMQKIFWLLQCLGCPFIGLFYFVNIGNDPNAMCIFWLQSYHFTDGSGYPTPKPLGYYAKRIPFERVIHNSLYNELEQVQTIFKRCITDASILERLSSIVSAYYILVGIAAALSRISGQCSTLDWPYIPLLLVWTLPAVFIIAVKGRVATLDPVKLIEEEMGNDYRIPVIPLSTDELRNKTTHAVITAFYSIIIPPMTIIFAYFTPPIGYGCRSRYLTVICTIWVVNSTIAIVYMFIGEKTVRNGKNTRDIFIHRWFCGSGLIIAVALIALGLLTNFPDWWDNFSYTCKLQCQ